MSSFPRPVEQYFSRHHTEHPLPDSLYFPVLVNYVSALQHTTCVLHNSRAEETETRAYKSSKINALQFHLLRGRSASEVLKNLTA